MEADLRKEKGSDGETGVKTFQFDNLPSKLRENIRRLGWEKPMPVQSIVIPYLLEKRDIVVQSRTGSGKTGAFILPMVMDIDRDADYVQGLVLVPTRELAEQLTKVLAEITQGTGVRYVAVYGGVGYGPQIEAFKNRVQIIIATPGRMIDHLIRDRVSLSKLRYLIFDEADEMLSMGFYESMMKIMSFIPERRLTALFSATIPPGVAALAQRFTNNPENISLSSDVMHVEEVDHVYYVVDPMRKDRSLLRIIEMENPQAALIFCNTKAEVEYLAKFLQNFGYDADFLTSDLSQKNRQEVMQHIRKGQLRFLVSTDVAARGIDISELGYVIVYDLPQAHGDYVHRAGRTGRAGEGGFAISLVSYIEEVDLKKRAKMNNLSLVKRELPSDEDVEQRVDERIRVMLEEKYRSLPNSIRQRLRRFIPLSKKLAGGEEEMHVVAMMFDSFYQETLHKPLYPYERATTRTRRRPGSTERSGRSRRPDGRRTGQRSRTRRDNPRRSR